MKWFKVEKRCCGRTRTECVIIWTVVAIGLGLLIFFLWPRTAAVCIKMTETTVSNVTLISPMSLTLRVPFNITNQNYIGLSFDSISFIARHHSYPDTAAITGSLGSATIPSRSVTQNHVDLMYNSDNDPSGTTAAAIISDCASLSNYWLMDLQITIDPKFISSNLVFKIENIQVPCTSGSSVSSSSSSASTSTCYGYYT